MRPGVPLPEHAAAAANDAASAINKAHPYHAFSRKVVQRSFGLLMPVELQIVTPLTIQSDAIIASEARQSGDVLRRGPSVPTLRALDAIHDRLQSPADRLLRHAGARSSYVVLPIFALANAGVAILPEVISGRQILMLAIIVGLTLGKPVGLLGASAIAVRLGIATKPVAYT